MIKQIETEIVANTIPQRVFKVLTKFDRYVEWNPLIKPIKGDAMGIDS